MAESSRSQITITLGRSGQVVKREGQILDNVFSNSHPIPGSKRSIRDRLGSDISGTEFNYKRRKGDDNKFFRGAANDLDDTRLRKDDLRFKLMRKNMHRQAQKDGQHNGVDLREKLSRTARVPTVSASTRHLSPEPMNARRHISLDDDVGILRRSSSTRNADHLAYIDSSRNPSSPWNLDSLRKRPQEGGLGTSRGLSPQRNHEVPRKTSVMRTHDDEREVRYMREDYIGASRPLSSAPYLSKPAVPAGYVKPVAPLPLPTSPRRIVQKYSYTVGEPLTVDSLLYSLGLEKYAILFKVEEVDLNALRQMRDNDLKELGIPMGPRKKILLALLSRSKRPV